MEEFFTFMLKAVIVFSVFWYLGVNFFKHSHEVTAWLEKRRLNKLAEQHKDRVVDITKVYKEQFGFLESAEYIQERVKEIKESLSDKSGGNGEVKVNALEFIFLVDELHTDVVKTDRGIYIVSRKNINDLLREQEKDTIHYAKKMREYALSFLPKEGEAISLNADEVLYWVRNGMLRRPRVDDGNKVFSLSPGLQEVCLDLREDFVDTHYALAIVSHADFIKIKERRVDAEKKEEQKTVLTPTNTLVEGRLELFSDNTRRMKLGEKVVVYDSTGKSWTENLKGERIEDDIPQSGYRRNGASRERELSVNDFVEKESQEILQESDKDEVEVILPSLPINQSLVDNMCSPDVSKEDKQTKVALKIQSEEHQKEEKKAREKEAVPTYVPERNLPIVDSFFEHLEDPHAKAFLKQKISERDFPFGFIRYEEGIYMPVKSLLEMTSDYLSDSASEAFASEMSGEGRSITDYNLDRFYRKLEELKIILFQDRFRRSDFISFKKDDKKYSIRAVKIVPSFCVSLDIEGGTRMDIKANARKKQDVYIDFNEQIIKGVQGTIEFNENLMSKNATAEKEEHDKPSTSLREERVMRDTKKVVPVNIPNPIEKKAPKQPEKKPGITLPEKRVSVEPLRNAEGSPKEETKVQPRAIATPKPEPKVESHNATVEKKHLKQKMKRETFLKKFCTADRLFSEKAFDKAQKDCEQFYYAFRVNPEDSKEAWLFFSPEHFKDILYPFLEKEKIEFSPSNKFLNNFLRDDFKGDLSRRYIYTVPDGSVVAGRLVKVNVPIEMLDGLRLDVGYRGGYREVELKKALDIAKETGDTSLSSEIQALADAIHSERFIECGKEQ